MGRYGLTNITTPSWECDYCKEAFNDYGEAIMHISKCEERLNRVSGRK